MCKYLGLQLTIKQLTKDEWQPMLGLVRKFIPGWQRRLTQRFDMLVLVKSVIVARPVDQLLVLDVPFWVVDDMNKWMCSFFWAGKEKVNGGQCLGSWNTI